MTGKRNSRVIYFLLIICQQIYMLPWIYVAKESNIFFFLLYVFTDINYSFLRNKKTVIKKEE